MTLDALRQAAQALIDARKARSMGEDYLGWVLPHREFLRSTTPELVVALCDAIEAADRLQGLAQGTTAWVAAHHDYAAARARVDRHATP